MTTVKSATAEPTVTSDVPIRIAEPVLRWSARAHSVAEIETELARIWASQDLTTQVEGEPGRRVPARTSVMNLVVVARRPEIAERCAATIHALTGRHPSRTIVISPRIRTDRHGWTPASRPTASCQGPMRRRPAARRST